MNTKVHLFFWIKVWKAWKLFYWCSLWLLTILEGVLLWAKPWGPLEGAPRKNKIELWAILGIQFHIIYSTEGSDFISTHSHILPKQGGRRCILTSRFFFPRGDSKMLKDKNGQKLSILSSWLIREYQSTGCQTLLTQAQWKKNLL